MTVSIIVAASRNGVIGKDNDLPWHLPAEQAYFKKVTSGHPVIMGRKTYESIGRALPGRQNIIITRDKTYRAEGCKVTHSLEEALDSAKGAKEVFIIGGSQIYKQALPLADKLYFTRVEARIEGDRFFRFKESEWKTVSRKIYESDADNPYSYVVSVMERNEL